MLETGSPQVVGDHSLLELLDERPHRLAFRAVRSRGVDALEHAVIEMLPAAAPAEAQHAFEAERRAALGLCSPRVVPVREVARADGRPYAVLGEIHGVRLDELGARRLGLEGATALLCDLLEALASARAHGAGLGHGALEPGWVVLDEAGEARVAGFGKPCPAAIDLGALAAMVRPLATRWPEPIDAWLERAADAEAPFASIAAAREALGIAPGPRGRRRLARLVKQALGRQAAGGPETSSRWSQEAPFPAWAEARVVLWVCLAVATVALAIEVFGFVR
jgi:hypothetical protein